SGKIAAKPAGQCGNGDKTQAMARSLHGSNPLARPGLLEPRGNVEVFAGFVNWSLAELCGSALTPNCRPRICPATRGTAGGDNRYEPHRVPCISREGSRTMAR